jgi:hypothetical protein
LGFFFSPGASLTSGLLGPSDTAIIQQSGSTPYITRGGLWWTNPVPAGSPNIPENFWNLQRNHFDTLNLPTVMQKQSNSTNIYGFASTSDVSVRLYGPVYSKGSYRLPDPIVTIIEVPSSGGGGGGTTQITTDTNAQLFWADARNLNISYDTLWIKWPSVMPSVAAVVYQMRELSSIATSLVNTSGDRQKLVEIASNLSADVHPTRKSLLQQYPVESLVYANEIDTLLHPSRQERMEQERAVYGALGNASKSMFDVFQEYPDVDMGGVDWIGIDRLQKTGMHL